MTVTPPPEVYEAVKDWAVARYNLEGREIVRPFWPGADYTNPTQYPDGCVVIDNPPFSILAQIIDYYRQAEIDFFLYAPHLTSFNYLRREGISLIVADSNITYENGAIVSTAFITNLEEAKAVASPELAGIIRQANKRNVQARQAEKGKRVTIWDYPEELLRATDLLRYARAGVDFAVWPDELVFVSKLENQPKGKAIYGKGALLGARALERKRRAEEEKRAAEEEKRRALAVTVHLSPREHQLINQLP